jgi:sortase (surface protein transpeptidase)
MVAVIKFVLIFEIVLLGFNQTNVLYVRKNEEQKPKEQRFKANENKPVMTE